MKRSYEPYEEVMVRLLAANPELAENKTEFTRQILKELGPVRSEEAMRKQVRFFLNDNVAVEVESEEYTSYEVVNDDYVWETQQGNIKIPVDTIDKMFYEYSRYGKDLSASEMRNRYNLKPWEWNSIKNRLQLTKDAHIFSPYTVDNTEPDKLQEIVAEKMSGLAQDFGSVVVKQYNQTIYKEYKKAIMNTHKSRLLTEEFLDCVLSLKPEVETIKLQKVPVRYASPEHIVVTIADIHAGAKVEGLPITRNYNSQILESNLNKAASIINSFNAKKVTILLMGDYIESFTGLNHLSSFQSMEHKMYGARAFWNAHDIIYGFLSKVFNLHSIYGVPGNHDRGDKSKEADPVGEIGLALLEGLKRVLEPKGVVVEYDSFVNAAVVDGINYISFHGDKRASEEKAAFVINKYGKNELYNVVASAHRHVFEVPKDGDNAKFRRVRVPSIFSGNFYSESNGWTTQPGFLVFANNGEGVANMYNFNV
jgi:ribosomal protein L24